MGCKGKYCNVIILNNVKILDKAFYKVINWSTFNASLTKIINKTGRKFDWKAITRCSTEVTFEYGTVENWYIEIKKR